MQGISVFTMSYWSSFQSNFLQSSPTLWLKKEVNVWEDNSSISSISSDSNSPLHFSPDDSIAIPVVHKIRNVRKSENHHCAVCGDRPTGYHYDVLSCNGCKTFFRRTIINNRSFTCSKGGRCQFTKDFRCACRACRFDKCIRVGMNSAAIQFPKNDGNVVEIDDERKDETMAIPEKYSEIVPVSNTRFASYHTDVVNIVSDIVHKEEVFSTYRRPGVVHMEADLTLTEVLRSSKFLRKSGKNYIPSDIYTQDPVKYWMICDLHLVVEFAKSFNVFRELSEHDQKSLLHQVGGALHVSVQSFYSYFNAQCDSLVFPDRVKAFETKMAIMNADSRCPIFQKYYTDMYTQPIWNFSSTKMNTIEFSFFKALLLFGPDNIEMSLEGRSKVGKERSRLTNFLRAYLCQEYGFQTGINRLSTILLLLSTFVNYGEKRRDYISLLKLMQFKVAKLGKDVYINSPNEMEK